MLGGAIGGGLAAGLIARAMRPTCYDAEGRIRFLLSRICTRKRAGTLPQDLSQDVDTAALNEAAQLASQFPAAARAELLASLRDDIQRALTCVPELERVI